MAMRLSIKCCGRDGGIAGVVVQLLILVRRGESGLPTRGLTLSPILPFFAPPGHFVFECYKGTRRSDVKNRGGNCDALAPR
jgi:hypothetical protein